MIYLDTHVVVWLYAGEASRFSENARRKIEENDLLISPVVLLEMQYLREVGRIKGEPALMIEHLSAKLGLRYCPKPTLEVVTEAMLLGWTRDPFDRMIVAAASIEDNALVTKDQVIRANYAKAVWD